MRYTITAQGGYLRAEMTGRDTAAETREFVDAIVKGLRESGLNRLLIVIRQSRAIFKVGEYNIDDYFKAVASIPDLRVAHVGDTAELRASQEYIALRGKQHGVECRALKDEKEAVGWLLSP